MAGPKKTGKPASDWQRTRAGAVGDDSMDQMLAYNADGAGVDESKVRDVNGDPNDDLPQRRRPGSEA